MRTNFAPFPTIKTNSLWLRRMEHSDIGDLFEMRSDPRMNEYTDAKLDESEDETRAYIDKMNRGVDDGKWIIWAIEHKQSGKVIGSVSIWNLNVEQESGEFGFGIIPDYQGQGLMKESLLSAIDYGFDVVKLKELYAYTEEHNLRSIGLLRKCGFVGTNRVDEKGYFHDRVYHMVVFKVENDRL